MKIEIKNWLSVVVLLCLGFILGRVTLPPNVKAEPQQSEIGRYQLVAGTQTNEATDQRTQTVFRIDTQTGKVERWFYTVSDKAAAQSWWLLEERKIILEN